MLGNDEHGGLGRDDDAADGVDRELMHGAGAWRAQLDALELVFRRDAPLRQFGDLALDLAQLLLGLGAQVIVDLHDLQLDLGDLAFDLRDRGGELALLAVEIDGLTFEPVEPHDRRQTLWRTARAPPSIPRR